MILGNHAISVEKSQRDYSRMSINLDLDDKRLESLARNINEDVHGNELETIHPNNILTLVRESFRQAAKEAGGRHKSNYNTLYNWMVSLSWWINNHWAPTEEVDQTYVKHTGKK